MYVTVHVLKSQIVPVPLPRTAASKSFAQEYATLITPSVIKWFASNDRAMRANLLSNLESFVHHLSPEIVSQIFLQIVRPRCAFACAVPAPVHYLAPDTCLSVSGPYGT
jgi:hypothetical protein